MQSESETILVVDDDKLIRWSFQHRLMSEGYQVVTASSGEEGLQKLAAQSVDLVVLDMRLPGKNGFEVLEEIKRQDGELPVVFVTAHATIESAVQAVKMGAYDYVTKPVEIDDLLVKVRRSLEARRLKREVRQLRRQQGAKISFDSIIHQSPKMREAIELAKKLTQMDRVCVLLEGETGTGKDLLAKSLHGESPRADKPFLEINCSAVPLDLLESELFGHEKGAFTDASKPKEGLLELADRGTLFMNEIGDMDLTLQAKILSVLESKPFRRVGGTKEISVDVRFIAATNRDLKSMVAEGKFRGDLYHRLTVFPIGLSPLRERKEDILLLAHYYLEELRQELRKENPVDFSEAAQRQMLEYHWPGNVREMKNVIERAVILCSEDVIHPHDLRLETGNLASGNGSGSQEKPVLDLPQDGIAIEEVERELLLQSLERTNWNQSQAATLLHVGRDALRYRMKKFGLLP